MKFAKELGAHITPEWRKQYIQYERFGIFRIFYLIIFKLSRMKSMLDKHMQEVPDIEHADDDVVERFENKFKVDTRMCISIFFPSSAKDQISSSAGWPSQPDAQNCCKIAGNNFDLLSYI